MRLKLKNFVDIFFSKFEIEKKNCIYLDYVKLVVFVDLMG